MIPATQPLDDSKLSARFHSVVHTLFHRRFLTVLAFASLFLLLAAPALADPVAIVVRASGEVIRIDPEGTRTPLARRDELNVGDRIETGEEAYVTLRFADRGLVELGTGSRFVIQRYQAEAGTPEEPRVLLELIEGRLRTVTGALAKDPEDYDLQTPVASIGIRGTEFEVWQAVDTGTRVRLTQGSVSLVDNAGLGDPVVLTDETPFGEVKPGAAASLALEWSGPSMGSFPPSLLNLDIPGVIPPLVPVAPPMVVPLSAEVPTAAVADADSEPDALTQFIRAVDGQQWQAAQVLAGELRERFEGTPRFDLYYALLLLHENRTQEAIFALERVLTFAPTQHRARLELARAYFVNNNLARARTEFERVLATNPPANVRSNIESFLSRIDAAERARNRQFKLFAGLEAGWDSNINDGATLNEELDPNLLNLTSLSEDSKALDSSYGRLKFGAQWLMPSSLNSGRVFSLQGHSTLYPDRDGYNQNGVNARFVGHQGNDQLRGQISVSSGYTWIGSDPWQLSLGLGGQMTQPLWGPLWGGVTGQSSLGFAQSSERAHTATDAAGLVLNAEERERRHELTIQYLRYQQTGQDDGHLEWSGLSNRYSLGWKWPYRLQTQAAVRHDIRRYQDDDLLFTQGSSDDLKRRQDQFLQGDFGLVWQADTWLQSRTGIRFEWLDSNINAYSHDQWVISQTLTVTF